MRSISPFGPSRHFAWAQQSGRFWREADINRQAEPAGLVASDPNATSAPWRPIQLPANDVSGCGPPPEQMR